MKVRKKDLCHTCRRRKLQVSLLLSPWNLVDYLSKLFLLTQVDTWQCDGKRPTCSQCQCSKRKCEGYPEALFVPFVSASTVQRKSSRKEQSSRSSLPRSTRVSPSQDSSGALHLKDETVFLPPRTAEVRYSLHIRHQLPFDGLTNTQEMVYWIIHNYVPLEEIESGFPTSYLCSPRICGSWVTALPELTTDTTGQFAECLHSAVSTLALSIISHLSQENLLQVASTQYESSIQHLTHSLAVAGDVYRNELVAAVMCLALSEVSLPKLATVFCTRLPNPRNGIHFQLTNDLAIINRHSCQ